MGHRVQPGLLLDEPAPIRDVHRNQTSEGSMPAISSTTAHSSGLTG